MDGMLQSRAYLCRKSSDAVQAFTPQSMVSVASQFFVSDFKPSAKPKEGVCLHGGRGRCIGAEHGLFEGGLLSQQLYLTLPEGLLCARHVMFEGMNSISFYKNVLRCLFLVLFL